MPYKYALPFFLILYIPSCFLNCLFRSCKHQIQSKFELLQEMHKLLKLLQKIKVIFYNTLILTWKGKYFIWRSIDKNMIQFKHSLQPVPATYQTGKLNFQFVCCQTVMWQVIFIFYWRNSHSESVIRMFINAFIQISHV